MARSMIKKILLFPLEIYRLLNLAKGHIVTVRLCCVHFQD